ncbi:MULTISPECIES: acyl-CoA synthetase [Pseudonocardia]|uniref:Long-chain-fatty-acid--CoA ligase FadD13 n=2 Tax=Pseudonocardia TaxID=1847 RepID=A0A1Y2MVN0_PSEAH|nr:MULTISPECIES: long-chain fatty acid--CoA ligase [Pseudonocardia]OSY39222.1 Long-chain-fatty-acid--CoA ligase FadD13 [Pseudonocardia autotrophica]TDN76556.1 fatty-acyl-CoA synthase [Pseudonocardia autotrophica]BBG00556.1 fatty-acyl-CoA synthase [Pseudonocardia autotrophica]GEC28458.1 fatty-acyl-CoA synthase [Pseudonocardia saturnea]
MSPITGPGLGLGTWPARRARISPDAPALLDRYRSLSYAELAQRVAQVAGGLTRLGVRSGDRIAYLGVNAVEVLETCFAAWSLGAIAVPLNHRLAGDEVRYMLEDCGACVLVYSDDAAELVTAAGPLPPSVRHLVAVRPAPSRTGGPGAVEFEAGLAAGPPVPADGETGLDDPAVLLYTSGTTGRPKAAILTHGNLTWNTVNQLAHVDLLSTDRTLCISPLFHCVGLSQVTLPALLKGASVELVERFDPALVLSRIADAGISGFAAVPTMLQMLCEHPGWAGADLSSLRSVVYGGSPVQERVARAWLERGVHLQQGYGMTEASPGVYMATRDGTAAHPPTSIGVPHFFTDVAILRESGPEPVGDEPGELLVRGPHVGPGYWERPQETAASRADGGWFRTGDVVRADPDGWAFAVDRVKDMYISGGENVYPAEVEAVAVGHDAVADCAVVGIADERWGEVGVAYVQPRPGAVVDPDELRVYLAARLARYKVPRYVELVEDLPRNATGKVRRVELRDRAAAR